MSESQSKFFVMAHGYAFMRPFLKPETQEVEVERLRKIMGRLSSGEQVVAHCLISIWTRDGAAADRIDLTDLAALSTGARVPILEWLADPFWP